MANFNTHITTSTIIGVGYGTAGYFVLPHVNGHPPLTTCLLSAGLCSVAGMLPDLDSDSSIPLRETVLFTAAVVPMLLMHRFGHFGLDHESMVLAGVLVYLFIRFGFFELLKRYTVHRGMFHSIPAALIAAELAFLLCTCENNMLRYYKAGAVFIGYMTHLVLDELYSVDISGLRLKKSFGTAMKFWGTSQYANISTYAKLFVLAFVAFQDPYWVGRFESHIEHTVEHGKELPRIAVEKIDEITR